MDSFIHYFKKDLCYVLGSKLNRIVRIKKSVLKDSYFSMGKQQVDKQTHCDKSKMEGSKQGSTGKDDGLGPGELPSWGRCVGRVWYEWAGWRCGGWSFRQREKWVWKDVAHWGNCRCFREARQVVVTSGYGSESSMEHGPHDRFIESDSPWMGLK